MFPSMQARQAKRTSVSFLKKEMSGGANQEIKGVAMLVRRVRAQFVESVE